MNVMRIIEAGSVNEMVKSVLSDLQHNGKRVESRNGGCVSVKNRYLQIDNPRLRHLSLVGRKYNIYAMMAETFWVLAGDDRIGPYLEYFLPRAPDYSDDGITWRGGYGPRIFGNDQVQNIMDIFAKEGPSSRRAVMSIYEPSKDTYKSLSDVYGLEKSKDIPCNLMLHFFTEHDATDTLNMRVMQRSGDILWGLGSINMFEWTLFQEIMANSMGLKLGYYIHEVFDAHLYDKFADQGVAVLESPQQLTATEAPTRAAFSSQANMQAFYGSLVAELSKLIACEDQSMITQHLSNIGAILDGQGLDTNDVQRGYVAAVVAYILHKNGYDTELSLPEALSSTNFVQSLQNCVFTKFPISFVKE